MILANKNNERISAYPKEKALCPICNEEVISKCGKIKIWHWSHKSLKDCDNWAEPESEWHLSWKKMFPKEMQEKRFEKHIADIYTKKRIVIELQSSPISPEEIKEREKFYKNMIWVLNGKTIGKNIILQKKLYNWKWFPKSWANSQKRVYLDIGNSLLIHLEDLGRWGLFSKEDKNAFIIENGGRPWLRG